MLVISVIVALVVSLFPKDNGVLSATTTTEATKISTDGEQILKTLPNGIPSCHDDANLNECIRKNFNILLQTSKNGIPEISIPAIDPWLQEKIKIEFSNNIVHGKALARHIQVYGFSQSNIDKTEYSRNGTKLMMKLHLTNPKLQINGEYKAQIQWNTSKLPNSKGVFNITITGLALNIQYNAELYERDGVAFVKVTQMELQPNISGMHISATGLVPEPELNNVLLEVLNDNWNTVSQSVLPAIQSTLEQVVIRYCNAIFAHLPFSLIVH